MDILLNQLNIRPDPVKQCSRTLNRQPEELILQAVSSQKEDILSLENRRAQQQGNQPKNHEETARAL